MYYIYTRQFLIFFIFVEIYGKIFLFIKDTKITVETAIQDIYRRASVLYFLYRSMFHHFRYELLTGCGFAFASEKKKTEKIEFSPNVYVLPTREKERESSIPTHPFDNLHYTHYGTRSFRGRQARRCQIDVAPDRGITDRMSTKGRRRTRSTPVAFHGPLREVTSVSRWWQWQCRELRWAHTSHARLARSAPRHRVVVASSSTRLVMALILSRVV